MIPYNKGLPTEMPIVAEHPPFPCISRKDVENITEEKHRWKCERCDCASERTQHTKDCQRAKLEQFKAPHCLYYVILVPGKISSCKLGPEFPQAAEEVGYIEKS